MRFCSTIRTDRKLFLLIAILALPFLSLKVHAQFSPYSRYGIGDIPFNGFIKNIGMGGTGIGMRPYLDINITNPASYSSLMYTAFDVGVTTSFTRLSTLNLSQRKSDETFSYFALGFPVVNKKWGAALGLVPFSNVGYKISTTGTDLNGGDINYSYEGTGGINRVFVGNAVTIKKHLSAGFDASYLFGTLDRIGTTEFDGSSFFNSRFTASTVVRDFYFDYGLQYAFDSLKTERSDSVQMYRRIRSGLQDSIKVLTHNADSISSAKNANAAGSKLQHDNLQKKISELESQVLKADSAMKMVKDKWKRSDWSLSFGVIASLPANISASADSLTELYQGSGNFITIRDTILNEEGEKGNIKMPLTMGFGISLKKGTQWLIAADVSMQSWKDYSFLGLKDSLRNSLRISAGAQYTPSERGIKSYWQTVQYRLGGYYSQTYLQLKGTQLNEYGITTGLGLPIRRGFNTIHLSAVIGTRGTTDNNLIKENFVRISLGVTFSDRWFIKPKYD